VPRSAGRHAVANPRVDGTAGGGSSGWAHAVTLRCSWCWPHDPEIQGREDGWTFADGVLFLNQYHRLRNPNVSAPSACAVGLRRRPAPSACAVGLRRPQSALQSRCNAWACASYESACVKSRCRCGRGEPSPGADVAGVSPVPVQMWQGRGQSRCRCGKVEASPGADVAGVSPVPVRGGGAMLAAVAGARRHRARAAEWDRVRLFAFVPSQ
jgi:hypothetical protein